ncbi:glycosyltransferase family 4 protein, partial [candidate division WOR-3 bacterium]|nr:glycosyltransferase family 4 protein [candidate division WOR-3 bacterium]
MDQKIGIIGVALAPQFNEAYANEMFLLSKELRIPVLTCNDVGLVPFKKVEQYLIVNMKFLSGKNPILSLLNGVFLYLCVKLFERKFDIIFLPGGINIRFLNYLNLKKCILIINTIPFNNEDKEVGIFIEKFAPKLRGIIAQSKRLRDRLIELEIDPQKIHLIYPWVDLNKFSNTKPPDSEEIRILFASAPLTERPDENIFEWKGISLLLEAFKEFAEYTKATLCLLWRGYYNDILERKIRELDLESRVSVINEVGDMPGLYAQSHITVIPFLNTRWSPEIPLSAVESLACGRPVVTTDVVELSKIIQTYKCGCIAKPTKEDFLLALKNCKENYAEY